METLLVQPSSILGDSSLRGIAASNQCDVDYFLFVTSSSDVSAPIETSIAPGKYQLILPPRQQGLYDLVDILSIFRGVECTTLVSVVLRNYLELGNFFITDQNGRASLHYCVIGDTHHLSHSLTWCFDCLSRLKPKLFFSRSNPHHAILLAACLKQAHGLQIEHSAAPDYLLLQTDLANSNHISRGHIDAALCISNLQYQLGRRRLVKKLLGSRYILGRTKFFNFMPESEFRDLLLSARCLLIPSINGQISPQIFYAISRRCLPVVDCFTALRMSEYHRQLLPIVGSLKQVVVKSIFSSPHCSSADFISLSNRLQGLASSEVSFVQAFLSCNTLFRHFFSLSATRDHGFLVAPNTLQNGRDEVSLKFVLSQLDQIKLLSLREPFMLHQDSVDQAIQSLLEVVGSCELQCSVALSLQVIIDSRQWLYD